ncbi:hypothetical protein, partial [Salmonella enterica]|uniref:hypothetical protein n=1 Tax=Salmonella enterica TaxID=28901 RepID=UPI003FA0C037
MIAAGISHTLVLTHDLQLFAFGYNGDGQLGNGISASSNPNPLGPIPLGFSQVVQIVAGANHGCARNATGVGKCWGNNGYSQLGGGSSGQSALLQPVFDCGGEPIVFLAAGNA